MENKDPMSMLGFGMEEIDEALREAEEVAAKRRDPRICACGHPVKYHTQDSIGYVSCQPGRQLCPCAQIAPVISVPDTRYFMRKSLGNSQRHALSLGIGALLKAKPKLAEEIEWIAPPICQHPQCGNEGVKLYPTHLTAEGVVTDEPSKFNRLFCDDCRFG